VGGLLVDDLRLWFVGDEPIAQSSGKTRMTRRNLVIHGEPGQVG
jgi:hypothetical protein